VGRPPHGQLKTCSTENCFPRTQPEGNTGGHHPYLKHKESQKAPLCKQTPWSSIGRAVSQLEEALSEDNMMDRYNGGDNLSSWESITN